MKAVVPMRRRIYSQGLFLYAALALSTLPIAQPALGAYDDYLIGRGKHDVTGPAAEVGMMGYADPEQIASGIHDRQWARAFVIAEKDGSPRVALVSLV